MRTLCFLALAALTFQTGCTGPYPTQSGLPPSPVGAPLHRVDDRAVADRAQMQSDLNSSPIRLPDRITLPAAYRLMLVDGHLTLVREIDARSLEPPPTSLRVIAGEISNGELAYQPGLLPQELAAEVAANRESSDRIDNELEAVLQQSRVLSAQALQLEAQSKKLAERMAEAESKAATAETPPAK